MEAYAGPGEGLKTMKASEWESFVTTMPHTEYPSASACICKVEFAWRMVMVLGTACHLCDGWNSSRISYIAHVAKILPTDLV